MCFKNKNGEKKLGKHRSNTICLCKGSIFGVLLNEWIGICTSFDTILLLLLCGAGSFVKYFMIHMTQKDAANAQIDAFAWSGFRAKGNQLFQMISYFSSAFSCWSNHRLAFISIHNIFGDFV